MPRLTSSSIAAFAFALALVAALPAAAAAPAAPAARKIPGINAPDAYPKGCVDCHVAKPAMDVRLSTALARWTAGKVDAGLLAKAQGAAPAGLKLKGKHPDAEDALTDIPVACQDCHSDDSKKAPPLGRMVHRIHLTGGDQNHFLTEFQGECTHCHKLNAATGAWSMPSGAEKK